MLQMSQLLHRLQQCLVINESFAPYLDWDGFGWQLLPFLPSTADSVAVPLVLSPFPMHAVSNVVFNPESEI